MWSLKLVLLMVCAIAFVGCTQKTPVSNNSPSIADDEKAACIMAYVLDQLSPIVIEPCSGVIPGFATEFDLVLKKFRTVNDQKILRGKILSDEEVADSKKKFPNSKYSNFSILDEQGEWLRFFQQESVDEQKAHCERYIMLYKTLY